MALGGQIVRPRLAVLADADAETPAARSSDQRRAAMSVPADGLPAAGLRALLARGAAP